LSGLLTCGCCGGRYGIVVNDRYGCLGHFRKGMCDNGRTIRRGDIEQRVLAGLTDKLVSPEAVAVAVRAYVEEANRQNHERRAQAEANRRTLEKIERSIKRILDAIEDGMYQPAMKARMGELSQQKALRRRNACERRITPSLELAVTRRERVTPNLTSMASPCRAGDIPSRPQAAKRGRAMRASLEGMVPVWPHVYKQVTKLGTLISPAPVSSRNPIRRHLRCA